jgi:DNA-binding transcriptional regulator YdaS (Cro superfamily)
MVTKMASGEKQVPLDHCPLIQKFTDGAVTCEELRPDKAEYFALIRAQTAGPIEPARPIISVPGYTGPDRRSPATTGES